MTKTASEGTDPELEIKTVLSMRRSKVRQGAKQNKSQVPKSGGKWQRKELRESESLKKKEKDS